MQPLAVGGWFFYPLLPGVCLWERRSTVFPVTYPISITNVAKQSVEQPPETNSTSPSDAWGVDGPLCPECGEEMTHQTHSGNADYYACFHCGYVR